MAWLGNWKHRVEITVDSTNIDSTLTHFPIPIIINDSSGQDSDDLTAIFSECLSNYQKIAVTEDDGITQLYVEVELWRYEYQVAVLWVSRSDFSLSSSSDTTLYLYYDGTQENNTSYVNITGSRTEVWDSNFIGVWHFPWLGSELNDATSNGLDLTDAASATGGGGKIGYGQEFDGSDDYYYVADTPALNINGAFSISAWYRPDDFSTRGIILTKGKTHTDDSTAGTPYSLEITDGGVIHPEIGEEGGKNESYNGNGILTTEEWNYVGTRWDGSDDQADNLDTWLGNSLDDSYTVTTIQVPTPGLEVNSEPLSIGYDQARGDYPADGYIDEVRLSDIYRPDAWMKAEYYSGNDDFLSYGEEETIANIGTWLGTWKNRYEITIDNSNIDESLTHFPIPIMISATSGQEDFDLTGIFDELGSSYLKLAVTTDNGYSQLPVEVEKWDDTAEEGVLWVSSFDLTLPSDSETTLYLYFDSNQDNNTNYVAVSGSRTEVWNLDYKAVWHLFEDPSDTTVTDATANSHDGASSSGDSADLVSAVVGDGQDFDGTDEYIDMGYSSHWDFRDSDFTMQFWVNVDTFSDRDCLVSMPRNDDNTYAFNIELDVPGASNDFDIYWAIRDDTATARGIDELEGLLDDTWYFISLGVDGANYFMDRDGGSDRITDSFGYTIHAIEDMWLMEQHYYSRNTDGILDEFRISSSARSAAWIKADYNAMLDNLISYSELTFYSGFIPKSGMIL